MSTRVGSQPQSLVAIPPRLRVPQYRLRDRKGISRGRGRFGVKFRFKNVETRKNLIALRAVTVNRVVIPFAGNHECVASALTISIHHLKHKPPPNMHYIVREN